MAAALLLDLRARVIAAIEAGTSCRQAAEQFGVGHASAIRWYARYRAEGAIAAKPMGGDRHSHRVEAHAALILQTIEERPHTNLHWQEPVLSEVTQRSPVAVIPDAAKRRSGIGEPGRSTP